MAKKPCCDKSVVKKGQWSAEEDRRLVSFIEQHGLHCGWVDLPKKAGLQRCGKSCRLRWLNYLRPGLRRGNYSSQEEEIICNLYSLIGSRWSVMASQLQGRTDNDIKNYWNTQLKYKYQERLKKQISFASAPAGKTEILLEATWKYADESSTSSRSSQGHVYDFSSAATAIDASSQIQYPVFCDPVAMVRAPPSVVASSTNEDYMMNKNHVISECSSTSADSGHYSIYNWNESDIANYVANASDYAYAHELSAAPAMSMSASISACTSQSQRVIFQEPLSCPSSSSSVLLEDATFDSLF